MADLFIRSAVTEIAQTAAYSLGIPKGVSYDNKPFDKKEIQAITGYQAPDEGLSKSKLLGTTVLSNLVIYAQKWIDNQTGNEIATFNTDIIIESLLISVGMQKHIITTPIQGRNGTVKEYISDGDYSIDIKGVLTAPNGQSVRSLMNPLIQACKAQIALSIDSWYLTELFNIKNIVITYYHFPQNAGGYSTQAFELQCLSDTPIELYLRSDTTNI